MKKQINIKINFTNKWLYTFLALLGIILLSFGVYASVNKAQAWHSGNQVEVTDPTTNSLNDLQITINNLNTKINNLPTPNINSYEIFGGGYTGGGDFPTCSAWGSASCTSGSTPTLVCNQGIRQIIGTSTGYINTISYLCVNIR